MSMLRCYRHAFLAVLALVVMLTVSPSALVAQEIGKDEARALLKDAASREKAGDIKGAIEILRNRAVLIEQAESSEIGKPGRRTANALGTLAGYALLAGDAKLALDTATKGFELAPDELWILTNRMLALILNGQHGEALAIYKVYATRPLKAGGTTSFQDSIENDLRDFGRRRIGALQIAEFVEASGGLVPREVLLPQVPREIEEQATHQLDEFNDRMGKLHSAGKALEALQVARDAATYAEATLGPNHKLTGLWVRGIADYQFSIDPQVDTRPFYRRALAIVERSFGTDHPDAILPLQTLATLDFAAGDHALARRQLERALAIAARRGPTRAKELAETYGQLANIDAAEHGKAAAEATLKRGLDALEKFAGDMVVAGADLRIKLADIYLEVGRTKEADDIYAAVLPVLEATTPPDHLLIAKVLGSRALYLQRTKTNTPLLLDIQERQLKHLQMIEAPTLSQLSAAHQNAIWQVREVMGVSLARLKRYAEAEEILLRALKFRETAPNQAPSDVASVLASIGILYTNMERFEEAVPVLERALAIREILPDGKAANLDVTLHQLALTYGRVGRSLDAEKLYKRTIELRERWYGPGGKDLAVARSALAYVYTDLDWLPEAGLLFRQALDAIEKANDAEKSDIALVLSSLAQWQKRMGRFEDAERSERRALDLRSEQFGPDAIDVARSLSGLASIFARAGRPREAEQYSRKAIAISENAPEAAGGSTILDVEYNNHAGYLESLGRFEEAEKWLQKALDLRRTRFGEVSKVFAKTLGNFAGLVDKIGRRKEGLEAHERALAIMEKVRGPVHSDVATALNNLAVAYSNMDRYADAERAYRRAIEINEKVEGPNGLATLTNLHNLAGLEADLGRTEVALKLYDRLVKDRERVLGPTHVNLAVSLAQMANALSAAQRHDEAIAAAKRALDIFKAVYGPDHYEVAAGLGALGLAYAKAGRQQQSLLYYEEALAIRLKTLPANHPDIATTYNNIGVSLKELGRLDEAEAVYRKGLAIEESAYGSVSPNTSGPRDNLAFLKLARRDWPAAIRELNANIDGEVASPRMMATSTYEISSAALKGIRGSSIAIIEAAAMMLKEGKRLPRDTQNAVFAAMQRYTSGVASGRLYQAGLRWGARDPQIEELIRARQENGLKIAILARKVQATRALAAADRDTEQEKRMRAELDSLQQEQREIEDRIRVGHPKYFDLVQPRPLTIRDVQALLKDDEVMINVVGLRMKDGTEANTGIDLNNGVVLAITREDYRFVRMDDTGEDLESVVDALRCGLDLSAWNREGRGKCARLIDGAAPIGGVSPDPLPFDLERAHRLYKNIFGRIEDLIEDRHLLVAAPWPLAQFPWHVLVHKKPTSRFADGKALGSVGWLGIRHPITMLSAPISLKILRRSGRPSQARRTWVGFGNPLLDGPDERYRDLAQQARDRKVCGSLRPARSLAAAALSRAVTTVSGSTRIVTADAIRSQSPLPETADELCEVAGALGAEEADVYLGTNATKSAVQRLSRDNKLAAYRLIHFATHGAKSGDLGPSSEPGLILTPGGSSEGDDNGFLSSTEIGELKLDADWVVLSACNTASDGGDGHSLSGLAQAFFFAGARSLLVSHWPVDSLATEALIKTTLTTLVAEPGIGRAEALRRGMKKLVESRKSTDAHPSKWAPFIVVGEGAAGR